VLKAKAVTDELSAALTHEKLAFKTFWDKDISPIVNTANQAASIRMLAQHFKAKPPARAPAKPASNAPRGGQGGNKPSQQGQRGGQGSNNNDQKGRKRRGRGRGKGKPAATTDKPKSDK
jgi:hypothetical protein